MMFRFPKRDGGRMATIQDAISILGPHNIFDLKAVFQTWGLTQILDMPVRYTTARLKRCALENKKHKAEWKLIYIIGKSFEQLYKDCQGNPEIQPKFFPGVNLWRSEEEIVNDWVRKSFDSGYFLINLKAEFCGKSFEEQEIEIRKRGSRVKRARENMVVEALFSIYKISNKRFLEHHLHRGPAIDSDGRQHVRVGYFAESGLVVLTILDLQRKDTGVVMCVQPSRPRKVRKKT